VYAAVKQLIGITRWYRKNFSILCQACIGAKNKKNNYQFIYKNIFHHTNSFSSCLPVVKLYQEALKNNHAPANFPVHSICCFFDLLLFSPSFFSIHQTFESSKVGQYCHYSKWNSEYRHRFKNMKWYPGINNL